MKPETGMKLTYGFWGIVVGAGIAMIIGFNWGGWLTTGTSEKMSEEAVLASHAAICVAQFMKDPNHETKLKEFEKLDNYNRAEFIGQGGWDKMPGQEKAAWGVSRPCVTGIETLLAASQTVSTAVK